MTYEELKDFLKKKMRMSHIYQPVMIRTLLESAGRASIRDIALSILCRDLSQIEYYESIVKNMVGRVLKARSVAERFGDQFLLSGFSELTEVQRAELIQLCDMKLAEYEVKRGKAIWSHRSKSSGYISGTLRYEVLKRAGFHCELCGISADQKALEVDHIVPRQHGGTDSEENLQALCYSCNSMKRDRDTTDFRAVRESYRHIDSQCVFCTFSKKKIVAENELAMAFRDQFPVTPLHTLVVPKRHIADYFDLSRPELNACDALLRGLKKSVMAEDESVQGFNIGMNAGRVAGQTVFHCHIHLIPRRIGDVENPRGGVRHLIPGKGYY